MYVRLADGQSLSTMILMTSQAGDASPPPADDSGTWLRNFSRTFISFYPDLNLIISDKSKKSILAGIDFDAS